MQYYAGRKADQALLDLLNRSRQLVRHLPDIDLGFQKSGKEKEKIPISCHMLARALASVMPELTVVDGYFKNGYEHSWLRTPHPDFILDAYPICILDGPILLDAARLSPWGDMYKPAAIHTVGGSRFSHHTKLVIRAMREVANKLP